MFELPPSRYLSISFSSHLIAMIRFLIMAGCTQKPFMFNIGLSGVWKLMYHLFIGRAGNWSDVSRLQVFTCHRNHVMDAVLPLSREGAPTIARYLSSKSQEWQAIEGLCRTAGRWDLFHKSRGMIRESFHLFMAANWAGYMNHDEPPLITYVPWATSELPSHTSHWIWYLICAISTGFGGWIVNIPQYSSPSLFH